MTVFADASALVKLYVDEERHEHVRRLSSLVVAQVSRVEVVAAIWGKRRRGVITADDAALLAADFEADYYGTPNEGPRFVVVATTPAVLDSAAGLVATRPLRAYDAVQLASGLSARDADPSCEAFAAYDAALVEAAVAEGFRILQ